MSFLSRRRALIAAPVTAALVIAGVGIAASPAWADDPITTFTELSDAVAAGGTVTLTQALDVHTQDLQVPGGTTVTLDLAGRDLTLRQFTLGTGANVTITDSGSTLPGDLTVSSLNYNEGGIRTSGATLRIDGQVVVHASAGDSAAGIGGGDSGSSGTISIGGTADVTATGGAHAAGIGGGKGGGGGATIEDSATVEATGGNGGAGIGGGEGIGGGVTVTDDAVVTAHGGSGAAGIGGGAPAVPGGGTGVSGVTISDDATVTAEGGAGGSGIGAIGTGGIQSIEVSGSADVTATGFGVGVGIGAAQGVGGDITFEDSSMVTAVGGSQGWGIGTGTSANVASITIDDAAHVQASSVLGSIGAQDDAFGEVIVNGELEVPAGKSLTLPSNTDYISGTGILSGAGTVVNNGSIALPDANVTVANVTVHNYQVSFLGNGGVLTPAGPIRLLAASFVQANRDFPTGSRSGFVLDGWKKGTEAFGGFSLLSGPTTLTAQWKDYAPTLPTPQISGTAKVGTQLVANPFSDAWADGTVFSYTWLRNGATISNADHDDQYTVQGADLGKQISVKVTGTNPGQPTLSKTSAKTAKVVSGAIASVTAGISGSFRVGDLLYSNPVSSEPTTTYKFQWYVDGVAISKATSQNWIATAAAQNGTVSVKVTASASGFTSRTILATSDVNIGPGQFSTPPVPTISGTVQTGQKLTAVPGIWSAKAKFTYQWYRDGAPVPGSTSSTLTLPSDSMSSSWSVRVVGKLAGYVSGVAYSDWTAGVLGTLSGATPKITGTAKVGNTLTAVPGTWTAGADLTYQWVRVSGSKSTDIGGATDPTYTLEAADKGKTIKLKVSGTKSGYATLVKTSSATKKVA